MISLGLVRVTLGAGWRYDKGEERTPLGWFALARG